MTARVKPSEHSAPSPTRFTFCLPPWPDQGVVLLDLPADEVMAGEHCVLYKERGRTEGQEQWRTICDASGIRCLCCRDTTSCSLRNLQLSGYTQVRSLQCHSDIDFNFLSFNFAIKHLQLVLNMKELFPSLYWCKPSLSINMITTIKKWMKMKKRGHGWIRVGHTWWHDTIWWHNIHTQQVTYWHLFSCTLTATPHRPIVSRHVSVFVRSEESPELKTSVRMEAKEGLWTQRVGANNIITAKNIIHLPYLKCHWQNRGCEPLRY